MVKIPEKGFTLVELATVIALVSMMSVWLYSTTTEAYRDYQVRAVMEQARESLSLLEIIRKTGIPLNVVDANQTALLTNVTGLSLGVITGEDALGPVVEAMAPVMFYKDLPAAMPTFSMQSQSSQVAVSFIAQDVAGVQITATNKSSVDAQGRVTFTFYARDTDPLIDAYTFEARHMKRQLGQ